MAWALRILSGLLVMTAPYLWMVGQTGYETANRNICEVMSDALPWALPTCRFHVVYAVAWGVATVAAILFIVLDSTRWVRTIASPHGGIRPLCVHCYGVCWGRLRTGWEKVEPSHIIILGLVIAAIGVAWQIRQSNATAEALKISQSQKVTVVANKIPAPSPEVVANIKAPLEAEIDSLKRQLESKPVPPATTTDSPAHRLLLRKEQLIQFGETLALFDQSIRMKGDSILQLIAEHRDDTFFSRGYGNEKLTYDHYIRTVQEKYEECFGEKLELEKPVPQFNPYDNVAGDEKAKGDAAKWDYRRFWHPHQTVLRNLDIVKQKQQSALDSIKVEIDKYKG